MEVGQLSFSLQLQPPDKKSTAGLGLLYPQLNLIARLPQCMSASHTLNKDVFVQCNFYEPYLQENYNLGCKILNIMLLHPELPKCKKTRKKIFAWQLPFKFKCGLIM